MSTSPLTSVEDLAKVISVQQEIATSPLGLDDLMRVICVRTLELIPATGSVVELVEGAEMVYRAMHGEIANAVGLRLAIDASLSGLCVRQNEVLRCDDTERDPRVDRAATRRLGLRAMICVPLVDQGRAVGVLKVFDRRPHAFGEREVHLLRLMAGLLSAVMRHAHEASAKDDARVALAQSERALRTLVDTAYEAVIISVAGRIAQCNPRFLEMFGLTETEALGRSLADFVAPFERERVRQNIATNYADFYEFIAYRPDGTAFPVEGRGRTTEVGGEQVRISTLRDVTERRRVEEALRHSEAESLRAARLKSEFMANMSHEIRTPLNGVTGLAELLSGTPLNEEQREYTRLIRASAETLLRLVNDILDFSKLEANRLEVEAVPFDLDALVSDVTRPFASAARAKQVELEVSSDVRLPPLLGDPTRLRQVVANLVSNAVKFTAAGRVTVRTRLLTRDESGYRLKIEVTDTGIGIPSHALDRLFQPFSQVDASMTRRFGGTGLGLSISKRLVEMMGGELKLDSREGHGSTFSFTLTLPTAPAEAAVAEEVAPRTTRTLEVLVAEDNAINQLIAVKMIEKMGHHATAVPDGARAVEAARAREFDVVLMDCQMPGLDGFEATRQIRVVRGPGLPIIAMTANVLAEDRERCLRAGMDDYIAKPMDYRALSSMVNQWTERNKTG